MGRLFASWIYLVFGFMGAFFSAGAWSKRLFCRDSGSSSCLSWYVGLVSVGRLSLERLSLVGVALEELSLEELFWAWLLLVGLESACTSSIHTCHAHIISSTLRTFCPLARIYKAWIIVYFRLESAFAIANLTHTLLSKDMDIDECLFARRAAWD